MTRTSRGRRRRRSSRNTRRTHQITHDRIGQESQASANYRNGATVRYRYRINGPTFPVTIIVDDIEITQEAHTLD